MRSVLGVDVSKGKSQAVAYLDKKKPYGKSFQFSHSKDGLEELLGVLEQVEAISGSKPEVILEATGHYHLPVTDFLDDHGYSVIILNPLVSQRARKSSLRKVKTDAVDAQHLAELYYKEDFSHHLKRSKKIQELQHLTRLHESITGTYVQTKLQFQAVIDQVFPYYVGVFSDMFCRTSLMFIREFTSPKSVIESGLESITNLILDLTLRGKSLKWAEDKARLILSAAQKCPQKDVFESHIFAVRMLIDLILNYQEHLACLQKEIDKVAESIKEYDVLRSIPGIGNNLAATILSEIGEIDRFTNAKKLAAFAGIDPSVFESGQFTATRNSITKRGSKRLRRALFIAIQCGIRGKGKNQKIRDFYDKKRLEGKTHKVATVACMNKLLHIIFALMKRGEEYDLDIA